MVVPGNSLLRMSYIGERQTRNCNLPLNCTICTGLKSELAVLVLDVDLPRRTGSRSRPMLPFSQPPSRASSVAPSETRSDVFPSQALRYNPPPPPPPPNLPATVCAAQTST